jgi:predicted GIY-YIG superfamily endonuclease
MINRPSHAESAVEANKKKHYWLYVLKLVQDKYYVGITTAGNPYDRIEQHKRGYFGAQWTKKFKPVETLEMNDLGFITQDEAEIQEDRKTAEYMKRYGYQNVRGGTLSYSGKYKKLGSWFMRDEDWKALATVLFILFALVVALIQLIADRLRMK